MKVILPSILLFCYLVLTFFPARERDHGRCDGNGVSRAVTFIPVVSADAVEEKVGLAQESSTHDHVDRDDASNDNLRRHKTSVSLTSHSSTHERELKPRLGSSSSNDEHSKSRSSSSSSSDDVGGSQDDSSGKCTLDTVLDEGVLCCGGYKIISSGATAVCPPTCGDKGKDKSEAVVCLESDDGQSYYEECHKLKDVSGLSVGDTLKKKKKKKKGGKATIAAFSCCNSIRTIRNSVRDGMATLDTQKKIRERGVCDDAATVNQEFVTKAQLIGTPFTQNADESLADGIGTFRIVSTGAYADTGVIALSQVANLIDSVQCVSNGPNNGEITINLVADNVFGDQPSIVFPAGSIIVVASDIFGDCYVSADEEDTNGFLMVASVDIINSNKGVRCRGTPVTFFSTFKSLNADIVRNDDDEEINVRRRLLDSCAKIETLFPTQEEREDENFDRRKYGFVDISLAGEFCAKELNFDRFQINKIDSVTTTYEIRNEVTYGWSATAKAVFAFKAEGKLDENQAQKLKFDILKLQSIAATVLRFTIGIIPAILKVEIEASPFKIEPKGSFAISGTYEYKQEQPVGKVALVTNVILDGIIPDVTRPAIDDSALPNATVVKSGPENESLSIGTEVSGSVEIFTGITPAIKLTPFSIKKACIKVVSDAGIFTSVEARAVVPFPSQPSSENGGLPISFGTCDEPHFLQAKVAIGIKDIRLRACNKKDSTPPLLQIFSGSIVQDFLQLCAIPKDDNPDDPGDDADDAPPCANPCGTEENPVCCGLGQTCCGTQCIRTDDPCCDGKTPFDNASQRCCDNGNGVVKPAVFSLGECCPNEEFCEDNRLCIRRTPLNPCPCAAQPTPCTRDDGSKFCTSDECCPEEKCIDGRCPGENDCCGEDQCSPDNENGCCQNSAEVCGGGKCVLPCGVGTANGMKGEFCDGFFEVCVDGKCELPCNAIDENGRRGDYCPTQGRCCEGRKEGFDFPCVGANTCCPDECPEGENCALYRWCPADSTCRSIITHGLCGGQCYEYGKERCCLDGETIVKSETTGPGDCCPDKPKFCPYSEYTAPLTGTQFRGEGPSCVPSDWKCCQSGRAVPSGSCCLAFSEEGSCDGECFKGELEQCCPDNSIQSISSCCSDRPVKCGFYDSGVFSKDGIRAICCRSCSGCYEDEDRPESDGIGCCENFGGTCLFDLAC